MLLHPWKITLVAVMAFAAAAAADTLNSDRYAYSGKINGIRNGKLYISIDNTPTEISFDLNQITTIELDAVPSFGEAEKCRESDAKSSAALYKKAIAAINKPEIKLLAEWRAIDPTDRDGRWSEALALFLDVYAAAPTEVVWKGKPSHWPVAGSKLYADGIEKMNAAIKNARSEESRKNLKTYLVEIYLKSGDANAAGKLAQELQTGIANDAQSQMPTAAVPTEADQLFSKKDYAGAVAEATRLLDAGATGEAAVQLYTVQAQAYESLGKTDDAATAWLQIIVHAPSSASAPGALQRAADLQKKLNRTDAAAALQKEILDSYPNSPQAAALKKR